VVVTAPAPSIGGGSYWLPPMSPSGDSDESSGGSRSGSGGGGGGSSGSGGGYSGNSNNNASNAPQAQKIFHNSSLNSTQWATIESMINKILADCIGRKLYDGVDSKMGDNTIKIGYNTALGEQGQFKGNEIVIGSSESNILYHELFHLYQYYAGGFSNFTSRELNYEVEAWYAQYVFTIGQQGYTGSYWERMYTRSDVGASIQKLGDEIRNNGTTSSVALSERINDIKTELSNLKGADGTRPYKNANYSSSYATLQFFLNFASGCL
jgi:hypothetical protein